LGKGENSARIVAVLPKQQHRGSRGRVIKRQTSGKRRGGVTTKCGGRSVLSSPGKKKTPRTHAKNQGPADKQGKKDRGERWY